MGAFAAFFVKPSANETIETVVHIRPDPRPALLGTVQDENGKPVAQALIAVYTASDSGSPEKPVGTLFTDEYGQFAFGPLQAGALYQIKVFRGGEKTRLLEPGV